MKIYTKKANKEYCCGKCRKTINKGDNYLSYNPRYSAKQIRCTECYPKPSELTSSEKMSKILSVQEEIGEYGTVDSVESLGNLSSFLLEKADEAREVAEDYRDSVDRMPENLQYSSKADELNEKADNIESWADEDDEEKDDEDEDSNDINWQIEELENHIEEINVEIDDKYTEASDKLSDLELSLNL